MNAPNDLELLPAPYPLPFKNDKHSILKVKFKTRPMKDVEKYGQKHDFKTFTFKTNVWIYVKDIAHVCIVSLIPSYNSV